MCGGEPVGRGHFALCIALAVLGLTGCSLGQRVTQQQEQYCLTPSPGQTWPANVTVVITCKAQIRTTPDSRRQYNLQLLHGKRAIVWNSTNTTVISGNTESRVATVHIHNFTEPDTGNYTCRVQLDAEPEGRTTGEKNTKVVIDSSHTPCAKKRERLPAKAMPESPNTVPIAIDVSIVRKVSNPNPPQTRVLDPFLSLNPTAISSTTEYGTKSTRFTSPSQSSTTFKPSRSVLGPQNTPPVPEDEEKYTFEYLWIVIGALIAAVGIFFMVATLTCIGKRKIAHSVRRKKSDLFYEEVQHPSPYEVPVPSIHLDNRRNSPPGNV